MTELALSISEFCRLMELAGSKLALALSISALARGIAERLRVKVAGRISSTGSDSGGFC